MFSLLKSRKGLQWQCKGISCFLAAKGLSGVKGELGGIGCFGLLSPPSPSICRPARRTLSSFTSMSFPPAVENIDDTMLELELELELLFILFALYPLL